MLSTKPLSYRRQIGLGKVSSSQQSAVGLRVSRPLHCNFLRWSEGRKGACACLVSQHYGTSTTRALSLPAGYCSAQSSHLDIIFPPEPPTTSGRAVRLARPLQEVGAGRGKPRRERETILPQPCRPGSLRWPPPKTRVRLFRGQLRKIWRLVRLSMVQSQALIHLLWRLSRIGQFLGLGQTGRTSYNSQNC